MTDDQYFKLTAQVEGLKMVVQTLASLLFAGHVKDAGGFAKEAEAVLKVRDHLLEHIDTIDAAAAARHIDDDIRLLMLNEMRSMISACLEGSEAQLRYTQGLILSVIDPASEEIN